MNEISNSVNESELLPNMDVILGTLGSEDQTVVDNQSQTVDTGSVTLEDIEIDPKYAGMDKWEARYRTMQSRYDKAQTELKRLEPEIAEKVKYESFLQELMEDDELLMAFLNERKPELVQNNNKDITDIITEKLASEFGDYQPDEDELRFPKPGSKAWLFQKRSEDIYNELKNSNKTTKAQTVKELKQKRMEQQQLQEAQVEQEMLKVKSSMNWDDSNLANFQKWAVTIKPTDLAKMYDFFMRYTKVKGNSIANIQVQPTVAKTSDALMQFFGK